MEKNKFHILVVDDDDKIRKLIKQFLNEKGFIVSTAINAESAKLKIDIFNFNLIILDVMMPGQTGYDLTKELKQSKNVPIILLTAKGEVENRIHGLELGADDYLGKPFEPQELLLRVKNIIKMNANINASESAKIGEAELNLSKMTIRLNKKVKKINSSEKNILVKMLSSPGRIFSRSEIGKISKISKERSIDVIITRLRKKIEINPKNPKFLQTIRGSYGLNKILKKILPRGLFYRSLIIVATPIIILQLTISIVFFDSIWIKANKGMTKSLISEIKTLFDIYRANNKDNAEFLTAIYKKNFDFVINIKKNENLPKTKSDRRFSPMDRSLRREMKPVFGNNYWFDTVTYIDLVDLRIQSDNGIIQIFFPKNKIAPSSVRIFVLWLTLPSVLLILIALVFLKNQTRPIVNLARAAERFGKGESIDNLRPSGASEIRKATFEFDRMMKRINRHLTQRSEMLSGISHDLRTPLTRLKLQLAMMDKKETAQKMAEDIDEMEKMLSDYLQYAKFQTEEKSVKININKLIGNILKKYDPSKYNFISNNVPEIQGRENLIKRCILNVIENGFAYGNKIFVETKRSINNIIITIEDNGPGIPKNEYPNVFRPFYRIDKSRGLNKSGIGLGLSIAQDITKSHGGNISLSESHYKGLLVKISFPF
jgi:two-component system osmolarity sensor histidine kinase EnvZ